MLTKLLSEKNIQRLIWGSEALNLVEPSSGPGYYQIYRSGVTKTLSSDRIIIFCTNKLKWNQPIISLHPPHYINQMCTLINVGKLVLERLHRFHLTWHVFMVIICSAVDLVCTLRLTVAGTRVWARFNLCGICGGQSGTGARYFRVLRFPCHSFIHIFIIIHTFIRLIAPQSSPSVIEGW
jgi:hypothetical protein